MAACRREVGRRRVLNTVCLSRLLPLCWESDGKAAAAVELEIK